MSLLFYTTADADYEYLAPLYIYCALRSNPKALVEIGLEDTDTFLEENERSVQILREEFGDQFRFTDVDFDGVQPNVVRFITEPVWADRADYVYIGDIDILLFDDDIEVQHTDQMHQYDAPFSNMIRHEGTKQTGKPRLTGLHFAPTDLQYPLPELDTSKIPGPGAESGADEHLLYTIMQKNGAMIPREMDWRPEHGIHVRTGNHPFGQLKNGRGTLDPSFEALTDGTQEVFWNGIEQEQYREAFLNLYSEERFQELFFAIDPRARILMLILENICTGRFSQLQKETHTYIVTETERQRLVRKGVTSLEEDGFVRTALKAFRYLF